MATIDDNIQKLMDFANQAINNARSAEGRIATFIPNVTGADLKYEWQKPNMPAPTSLGDLLAPDTSGETIKFLDNESEKWIDKYFPEINACLKTAPEEWLCGIITGQKPFGLSPEVFEAVWHEGRDREYRARNSAVRQLNSEFSARGFSLPAGAHIAAITQAERAASDAVGEVNRTQTVKDAEIKLDLLKFAEEQAIRLKLGIIQAMADFYRQWVDLPNKDYEAGRLKTQAYAAFQSSLASYYNVQLGFEELRLQAANLRMNGKLDESRLRVQAGSGDTRNAALGQAVQAYGDIAASASGSAGTLQANIVTGAGTGL
uniref:Putative structural protein n=1 Tax=viral metagenome TaxID=1070528 RepID=A0A6M3M849_9ZZZZ